MGDKGAFERPAFAGDGAGLVAIAFDLDGVVRANAVALFLQAPGALPGVVEPLAGARTLQAIAEFPELAFETRREALDNAPLLVRPRRGCIGPNRTKPGSKPLNMG